MIFYNLRVKSKKKLPYLASSKIVEVKNKGFGRLKTRVIILFLVLNSLGLGGHLKCLLLCKIR